jgi:hypothetical protein
MFAGSLETINVALNGLQFDSTVVTTSTAVIEIAVSDLGNTGSGTALSDSDTVTITVTVGVPAIVDPEKNYLYLPLAVK